MARRAQLRPGYRAAPGTARRVITPEGQEISHRQYRNIIVRESGWRSLHEFETSQPWAKFRAKIHDANPRADVSYSSRLARDYATVKAKRAADRKAEGRPGSQIQNTALGRLLIAAGIRDEGELWGSYV